MNITILGAGAIGSLWAYHLKQAQHHVHLWLNNPSDTTHAIALDNQPVLSFSANQISEAQHCDLLLVTVKAWQVQAALADIAPHLAPETIILLMHNGMGAVDQLSAILKLDLHPVVLATTTHGAYRSHKHLVHHTGNGSTNLGGYNALGKQCSFVREVLQHALPQVTWQQDIQQSLWQKLAINCAINPLTAIHQCNNGQLAQPQFSQQLQQIVDEVQLVMTAVGICSDRNLLLTTVNQVITTTAENYSSMQQDIAHQRPTEIDYITGYLCRIADKHGVAVPNNLHLLHQIKQLEQPWSYS